jgi:exonuclease VII small subunit
MQRRLLRKSGMSTKLNLPSQTVEHHRRRYVVLGLGGIALVAAIYFGPALREHEPNYYNPARTALVNARMRFEESLGHEQALLTQLQMVHEDLDSAITQLGKAADLDSTDRARIEALRSSLVSTESPDRLGEVSSEKLYQSYRDLLAQLEALIEELDNRTR